MNTKEREEEERITEREKEDQNKIRSGDRLCRLSGKYTNE